MKRKTNLFYLSGDDSKFITFSNYGESLTGNFLATDWKLFPSKFICMYIKYLDVDDDITTFNQRKTEFIKYVASYYENKMACLRDYCIEHNLQIENNLLPLNYLLEAIYRLSSVTDDITNLCDYNTISGNNENVKISFIGDISEQDYNGIYTDAINVISTNDVAKGDIIYGLKTPHEINYDDITTDEERNNLYGWWYVNPITGEGSYDGPELYKNNHPIFDFDENHIYNMNSNIDGINTEERYNENIKFNILIPLYDLVNINISTNDVNIVEDEKINVDGTIYNGFSTSDNNTSYIKDVPMGIWFNEEPIELKRNKTTGYAPSWSLLLSSQFKPFPYSQKIPTEITQDSTKEAFATYSQILIRQNRLLDNLEKITEQISQLSRRIDIFESKLNATGTSYTVDKLHTEMIQYENYLQNNLKTFKNEIYSYISNNWKGYIS